MFDEAVDMHQTLAEIIIEDHLVLSHNSLWIVADINEDGSQTWRNAIGDEVPSIGILKEKILLELAKRIQ